MCFGWACLERPPRDPDQTGDGDAGSVPADTLFALGVWNNSAGAPQAASLLNLLFHGGERDAETVVAERVTSAPTLDGDDGDWTTIPGSTVPLSPRGTASGLSEEEWNREYILATGTAPLWDFGIAEAVVKAAYDDERVYFLIQWKDDSENRRAQEWSFDGTKWNRSKESEDRVSLAFNVQGSFRGFNEIGCAAACHLHTRMGDVSDAGRAWRLRMHTARAGELGDIWIWRASSTNPMGHADDSFWDETGRKGDGTLEWSRSNSKTTDAGSVPAFMSELGVNNNPEALYTDDGGSPRAVPFDPTDALIGTRIPGSVMQRASPNRDDVRGVGRWRDGTWTVELSRVRETTDPKDTQFHP
jgi:hypothetical protein